ncbi:Acetyltransferase (isoleucine patch superfamily) [Succinivibrio dextrinosolvens]|uniref:acyltransferase n=1 Tax=Succinivibrio dextrinosolvens TaxID=83771 RepID=UPI0008DEFD0C|nr:acyltransferase [Succinivibrio dextrinosolvens]SFS83188.1 Acetyltransferase (isoleucine patch superfamily) [Succinivibrio dextrinosolvens]
MHTIKKKIFLQCKFFLVAYINITSSFLPNPLRKYFLRCFGIIIGRDSTIHRNCRFFHIGNVKIGKNSIINFGCYLDNRRRIIIGNNVGIAHNTKIYTLGHNINSPFFETKGAPVIIEDDSFIFSNCLIMPGVKIHRGAVVLAGSVVVSDVPEWTIVGGNPAIEIRKRNKEINYLNKYGYWFAL